MVSVVVAAAAAAGKRAVSPSRHRLSRQKLRMSLFMLFPPLPRRTDGKSELSDRRRVFRIARDRRGSPVVPSRVDVKGEQKNVQLLNIRAEFNFPAGILLKAAGGISFDGAKPDRRPADRWGRPWPGEAARQVP